MNGPMGTLAAAIVALLLIAMVLGNTPLLIAVVFVVALVTMQLLVRPPEGLAVKREVSRSTCWVGDSTDIETEVEVDRGIGPVYVFELLPADLTLEEGTNLHVLWKWPGRHSWSWRYTVRLAKRGEYTLTGVRWTSENPMGTAMRWSGAIEGTGRSLAVVPRLAGVQRLANARAKAVTSYPSADLARIGVATTDFRELREYVPGDPIRNINWKATARLGENAQPMVNQFDPEGRRAVWLFVDAAPYMQVGTTIANPLEEALEAASGIAHFYLTRGYTLGATIYNNKAGMLPPEVGQKQFRKLTEKLVRLSLDTKDANPEGLRAAVQRCRHYLTRLQPQVVVITRLGAHFANPASGQAAWWPMLTTMRQLGLGRQRGRVHASTWLVTVGGGARLAGDGVIDAAVSELLHWEIRPMIDQLRTSGVSVLDWDPRQEQFAVALHKHLVTSRLQR